MCITREDIDEAGRTYCSCKEREKELVEELGLQDKPQDEQERLCPDLKTIREEMFQAASFLCKHN